MSQMFDSFPEDRFFNSGFADGLKYGHVNGSQQMYQEGENLGRKLGKKLGLIYTDLILLKKSTSKHHFQIDRLVEQVLDFPLSNEEDPLKDDLLKRIETKHREFMLIHGFHIHSLNKIINKLDLSFYLQFIHIMVDYA